MVCCGPIAWDSKARATLRLVSEGGRRSAGAGLAIGISIGVAIGAATDNLGLWLAVGVALGAAFDVGRPRSGRPDK